MTSKHYQPSRRNFLTAAGLGVLGLPTLSLDGLVSSAFAQVEQKEKGPVYTITIQKTSDILERTSDPSKLKIAKNEENEISSLTSTPVQIKDEYRLRVRNGEIPDVRHLYDEVERMAQFMSRNPGYLADSRNGFALVHPTTDAIKSSISQRDSKVEDLVIIYERKNVEIAGIDYNVSLGVVLGKTLQDRNGFQAIEIGDLSGINLTASSPKTERIYYQWGATKMVELWEEFRVLDSKRALSRLVAISSQDVNDSGQPILQMLDLSGVIRQLKKAVQGQVVYFDKDWNPIQGR